MTARLLIAAAPIRGLLTAINGWYTSAQDNPGQQGINGGIQC